MLQREPALQTAIEDAVRPGDAPATLFAAERPDAGVILAAVVEGPTRRSSLRTDLEPMRTSTWRAGLLLVATFALGALAGGAAVAFKDRDAMRRSEHHSHRNPGDYLEGMARKLKLTPAQKDSVRTILERHRPAMDSIWRQLGPRFGTLRDSISNEIRRQLTPEQLKAYNEMIRRYEAERHGPPN